MRACGARCVVFLLVAARDGAVLTLRGLQIEEELGLWDVVRRHANDA
jgi:hypothetical protein